MNAELQQASPGALVDAARDGSLPAARLLVERFQRDLLATAYLLTGDHDRSLRLAGQAFARFFEALQAHDPEDDPLPRLFDQLARCWLDPDPSVAGSAGAQLSTSASSEARYRVDDERSRLRAALELLAPADRLALIASDYAGLRPGQLAEARRGGVEPDLAVLRGRVARAANLDDERSLPAALRSLAVEAPRVALWEEIGPDIEALFARRRQRARRLVLWAAGAVTLALLAVAALLIRGALVDGQDDERSGAVPAVTATSRPVGTTPPTAVPRYDPPGQVPHMLVYAPESGDSNPVIHDPVTGARYPLPGSGPVLLAPDGGTLLQLEAERSLVAASTVDGSERWRVNLSVPDEQSDAAVLDLAAVGDRVYAALYNPGAGQLSIVVIQVSDGSYRDTWQFDLGAMARADVEVDLLGTLAPLEPALTVLARGEGWMKVLQLDLPSGVARIDSPPLLEDALPPGRALLSPDGRALLAIPANGPDIEPSIPFLLPDTLVVGQIALPFARPPAAGMELVEYIPSHDGRWLYAIAPYAGRVAVVDLTTRQLERVIDLDGLATPRSIPAAFEPEVVAELYAGNVAAFSLDGRRLYALGPLAPAPGGGWAPVVWTIDTATWTVIDERLPDDQGRVASVHASAGEAVYLGIVTPDGATQLVALDGAGPSSVSDSHAQVVLGTLDDLYRAVYGRSPAVAGEIPRDNYEFTTIPFIDVEIDPPSAPSGWEFQVRVVLRDPVTGRPLDGVTPGLRGADPAAITTTFRNGGERRAAVLGPAGAGTYAGQIVLDRPGAWDLALTAGDPAGGGWSVARAAVAEVVDIVTDSAGREYVLVVTTLPAPPVAGAPVELTVTFEHINSGLVLPNSEIPSSEELERALPATLALEMPDGEVIALERAGSIHYVAQARFPSPGVYFPTVRYTGERGQEVSVTVRVEVAPPPG